MAEPSSARQRTPFRVPEDVGTMREGQRVDIEVEGIGPFGNVVGCRGRRAAPSQDPLSGRLPASRPVDVTSFLAEYISMRHPVSERAAPLGLPVVRVQN